MSWCGLAERCRNAATNNTRAKENHETDVNGFFFFSIKHMDDDAAAARTNGEKLINVNGLPFMSWTDTGCRTIGGNHGTVRHEKPTIRTSGSPSDFIEKSQSYDNVDCCCCCCSCACSWKETKEETKKARDGYQRQTKDQSQLNGNGQYQGDNDNYGWGWTSGIAEQNKLPNIQCRRKPLTYKSDGKVDSRRISGFFFIAILVSCLVVCTSVIVVIILPPLVFLATRHPVRGVQLMCSMATHLLCQVCHWQLRAVDSWLTTSGYWTGSPFEFKGLERSQTVIQTRHPAGLVSVLWSTNLIGITMQNVFNALTQFDPHLQWAAAPVLVMIVMTVCVNANYHYCGTPTATSAASVPKQIVGTWSTSRELYHEQQLRQQQQNEPVIRVSSGRQQEMDRELWAFRQFGCSENAGEGSEGGTADAVGVATVVILIFVGNKLPFQSPWQRRRRKGEGENLTKGREGEEEEAEAIVAKKKRKLLDFFTTKQQSMIRRRRRVKGSSSSIGASVTVAERIYALIVDKLFGCIGGAGRGSCDHSTGRRRSLVIIELWCRYGVGRRWQQEKQPGCASKCISCERANFATSKSRCCSCPRPHRCCCCCCLTICCYCCCCCCWRNTITSSPGRICGISRHCSVATAAATEPRHYSGGIQSIGTFHQSRGMLADTNEIESADQELNRTECGYNNYRNYWRSHIVWKRYNYYYYPHHHLCCCFTNDYVGQSSLCRERARSKGTRLRTMRIEGEQWTLEDNRKHLSESCSERGLGPCHERDNGGGEEGRRTGKNRDEEQLSKDDDFAEFNIHLVVVTLWIVIVVWASDQMSGSRPVGTSKRRRKSGTAAEISESSAFQGTTTIRIIIHGPGRQPEELSKIQHWQWHSVMTLLVVFCDTCETLENPRRSSPATEQQTKEQWLRWRWCMDIFPAISPFPCPCQTGTWSLDFVKCTSLTMSLARQRNTGKEEALTAAGRQRRWQVKEVRATTAPGAAERGGEQGKEGRVVAHEKSMTSETLSCTDGDGQLRHLKSTGEFNGTSTEVTPQQQHHQHRPGEIGNGKRRQLVLLLTVVIIFVVNLPSVSCLAASSPSSSSSSSSSSSGPGGPGSFKYSTNVVKTKYGTLRGIVLRSHPVVEAYLGVPYATPPVGSLRYMPPMTPSSWKTIRLADRFAPVCPQRVPMPAEGDAALLEVPRERLAQLRRFRPLLTNQSEDCLYLNLYVPRTDPPRDAAGGGVFEPNHTEENPLKAAIVYVHGESFEWNSGNLYDGTMLAAHGNVIVVTINFRLGILGFLKTGTKDSAQGNFGLMDLVAGLHWLRENLPAFNGDGNKITVMGHGTGAALANILVVSPVASDLISRVILLSGSALSPWAIQREPLIIKRRVAEQTGCHGDLLVDDIAPCLRNKSVKELLSVSVDSPRFLPGFAPFIDGTVIVNPINIGPIPLTLPIGSAIVSTNGIEFANYPSKEILFGLTSLESYLDLNAQDLEFGFNETRRDRILRTFVRNVFHFHLNEIYSMLKNEYTDWERPARSPIASRDATMELLSDGHTAAPLIRMAYLHSVRGGRSYFLHFRHQTNERDFPQRFGSVRGEDVPFCLGLPLSPLFPYNYTKQDYKVSIILVRYLSNFAKSGNPNGHSYASGSLSSLSSSSATSSSSQAEASALTDISERQQQQQQRRSVAAGDRITTSAKKYLINSGGGSGLNNKSSSRLKLNAKRRRKRQPERGEGGGAVEVEVGFGGVNNKGGGGPETDTRTNGDGAVVATGQAATKAEAKFLSPRGISNNKNNNKHRNIYSSADNDKEAFLRNYELNINSDAPRRMKSFKGRQQKKRRRKVEVSREGGGSDDEVPIEELELEQGKAEAEIENEENIMLKDDDNAGVLNAVAAVQNGDMVDKNRDDNWLDEEDEEYYPSRDHFSDLQNLHMPFWDSYDSINQLYLEIGTKTEIKNHYRGHKLSMWLNLIPQLHASGDPELPMRHHHFAEESAQFYDGNVRSQSLTRPPSQEITIIQPPTTMMPQNARPQKTAPAPNLQTTDCPVNLTIMIPTAAPDHHQLSAGAPVQPHQLPMPPFDGGDAAANKKPTNVLFYNGTTGGTGSGSPQNVNNNDNASTFNLLRRLANSQFQSYNTALTVTVVVGCFLLLLNVLIFVGIYYQREKRVKETRQKDELVELDSQYGTGTTTTGESMGGGGGGMISGRSPSQGSEKSAHKGGGGMADGGGGTTTLSRKGSFQSVRNFGNFNEYRCYDEKNFQQQQLGHHHHFGSRHHLHHHHSHGSLNRKYLVDVCHNAQSGSVVDLPPMEVYSGGGGRDIDDCSTGAAMSRELSVSSSHIAHSNNVQSHHSHQNGGGGLHQTQQHHQHHHVCPSSRRQSMVTEGTQSDPISLQELEYETNKSVQKNQNKKGPKKRERGFDASECRNSDRATGTQTDNCGDDEEDEYPRSRRDGEQEDDEEEGEDEEDEEEEDDEELEDDESPGIPDPPPPPRSILTGGILRTASSTGVDSNCSPQTSHNSGMVSTTTSANSSSHAGNSSTPSATKKRVQIQEISV